MLFRSHILQKHPLPQSSRPIRFPNFLSLPDLGAAQTLGRRLRCLNCPVDPFVLRKPCRVSLLLPLEQKERAFVDGRQRRWGTAAPAGRTAPRGCSSTIWWERLGREPTASSSSRASSQRIPKLLAAGAPPSPSRSSSSPRRATASRPPPSERSW